MTDPVITLTANGITLHLDPDLYWSDEDWGPVIEETERSLTGALIRYQAVQVGGRPITLEPEDDRSGQMQRSVLEQLRAWAAVPGLTMTLSLRGETYSVRFRHGGEGGTPAITSRPMVHFNDTAPGDWYFVTVRLITL